jgi:hypothetical protein
LIIDKRNSAERRITIPNVPKQLWQSPDKCASSSAVAYCLCGGDVHILVNTPNQLTVTIAEILSFGERGKERQREHQQQKTKRDFYTHLFTISPAENHFLTNFGTAEVQKSSGGDVDHGISGLYRRWLDTIE